jgi:hypothetical protein
MSNDFVYNIFDPYGESWENVVSLQEFCKKYNAEQKDDSQKLTYDNMRKACRDKKEYKGWIIDKTKMTSNVSKDNKINIVGLTTDEKILRLSDENTNLKNQLKDSIRSSSLFKEIVEVINNVPPYNYIPELKLSESKGKIIESACLVLSDLHSDQLIKAERVNNLEDYNFNAFCHRAENLVETTIKHLTQNLQGYSFETLYIFSLGDNIAGLIHNAQQHTETQNVFKNSLACGSVIAKMIMDLSGYFKKIVYIGISGNHPRLDIHKKDFRGSLLNFDFLVNTYAKTKCQALIDTGRVEFAIPDSWSAMIKIYNFNFNLSHGDTRTSNSLGLPFYALQRRSYRLAALGAIDGMVPHYQICGHFHSQSSMKQPAGELIINGAFPATDEYAYHDLSMYNEPSQLLFGVHPTHGKSWSMPIVLRDKNWRETEKKPARYNKELY